MSGDRTLPPSPARLARAHAAGVRGTRRWLTLGLVCLALAAFVGSPSIELSERISEFGPSWKASLVEPTHVWARLLEWGTVALRWSVMLSVCALVLGTGVTVISGGWGSVDLREWARLHMARLSGGGLARAALVGALVTWVGLGSLGVLAGAARAIDASPTGLTLLWRLWAARVLTWVGMGCALAGLVDRVIQGRVRWLALHQSVQQARDEARERGSRRA